MRAVAQVSEVQVRERGRRMFAPLSPHDGDHIAGVRNSRDRVEQGRVAPTEDGEVGRDAQGQRSHCQRGESRILAQLPQGETQVVHCVLEQHHYASASASSFLRSSSETTLPSNRWTSRSAWWANRGSCVTMQIVEPSRCRSASRCITASPFFESRLPVGSSASKMEGEPAKARATATRCC